LPASPHAFGSSALLSFEKIFRNGKLSDRFEASAGLSETVRNAIEAGRSWKGLLAHAVIQAPNAI